LLFAVFFEVIGSTQYTLLKAKATNNGIVWTLQKREISLTHIESRPSKQDSEHYDFFVDCVAGAQMEAVIDDLRSVSGTEPYVLTRSVHSAVADTG